MWNGCPGPPEHWFACPIEGAFFTVVVTSEVLWAATILRVFPILFDSGLGIHIDRTKGAGALLFYAVIIWVP